MKYVLTNAEMRAADKYTIEELKVPSLTLMERAGAALAKEAERLADGKDIAIVCGGGNNGGDGFVCARLLTEKGVSADVICVAEKFTKDCLTNKIAFEKAGGVIYNVFPRRRYYLLVDCLFGTGFKGELTGRGAIAADFINSAGVKVLSADIPSGVSGDGHAAKGAVNADETLCIGEYKFGALYGDGLDYAGEVKRTDIGITLPESGYIRLLEKEDVTRLIPRRKRNSHKGTYGKAAIVGGSFQYTGAAYLSTAAALKSGAGYTALFVPEGILPYYLLKAPEALLCPLKGKESLLFDEETFAGLLSYDSIAIGMGAGMSEQVFRAVEYLLNAYTGRLIIDADGLNSLAKYGKYRLKELFENRKCDVILTPHIKEFSRLIGKAVENPSEEGKAFAKEHGVTLLLKGAATLITDGERSFLNVAGSPAQAKGGSGDVLSGLIAGLCACGLSAFDGGAAGAYLAGKAAELAAEEVGEYSMTASDEISKLGQAFLTLF